jgi:hypothetical protein
MDLVCFIYMYVSKTLYKLDSHSSPTLIPTPHLWTLSPRKERKHPIKLIHGPCVK